MKLKNKTFADNLIQGPLAGVSCAPFRSLTWRYSQPAFACTEMISAKTLLNKPLFAQKRFIVKDPSEGPVCFQLSANNAKELGEATKMATDAGADLIDLNCGCPMTKIRKKKAGSSLLTNPSLLFDLITAMKNHTNVPVSIKIRVENGTPEKFNQTIADVVRDAGADFLVVHGRHWTQHYETPCNTDEIAFFVDALNIPVIGNGDIACVSSLKKMLRTGCAGVMIGRAGVGQPWLIKQLRCELEGNTFTPPPLVEIGNIFIEHVERLAQLLENEKFAVLQARKLAKYYARTLPRKSDFITAINTSSTMSELEDITTSLFN